MPTEKQAGFSIFIVILIILAVFLAAVSLRGDQQNYTNTKWNFSLTIPEGYLVEETDNLFYVVKKPSLDNETPLPEMRIKIEQSSKTNIDETKDEKVVNQEPVLINEGQCPVYRLRYNGTVYEFSLYECLESAIFETVVKSFKINQ